MSSISRRSRRFGRSFVQLAVIAVVTCAARAPLADHYRVPTGSMEPTVRIVDHILVDKAAYGLREPLTHRWLVTYGAPSRGDVVVLEADEPEVLLKRVVA